MAIYATRRFADFEPISSDFYQDEKMLQFLLIKLLRFYKFAISPFLGQNCRFYPSCSEYMQEAVRLHGAAHGTYLGCKRLCRCHPFSQGGADPVPLNSFTKLSKHRSNIK